MQNDDAGVALARFVGQLVGIVIAMAVLGAGAAVLVRVFLWLVTL